MRVLFDCSFKRANNVMGFHTVTAIAIWKTSKKIIFFFRISLYLFLFRGRFQAEEKSIEKQKLMLVMLCVMIDLDK